MRRGRVLGLLSFVKRRLEADLTAKTFYMAHPRRFRVIECDGITKIIIIIKKTFHTSLFLFCPIKSYRCVFTSITDDAEI